MSNLKDKIIDGIINIEKGYVDDPDDSGGETNWGVTARVARDYGYTGAMADMPREVAFEIYSKKYWDVNSLDEVCSISELIAEEMADTGVNCGVGVASEFLQRSLNVLNNRQKLYPDIVVDNDVGPKTISTLRKYLDYRGKEGEGVLYRMLNSLQGARYIELSERREKDEKYLYGWMLKRVLMGLLLGLGGLRTYEKKGLTR